MLYCPNCKKEYEEGTFECPECGGALVPAEEILPQTEDAAPADDAAQADDAAEAEGGAASDEAAPADDAAQVEDGAQPEDGATTEDGEGTEVSPDDLPEEVKEVLEREEDEEAEERMIAAGVTRTYVSNSEKYKDLSSSGYTLLLIGGLLTLYLVMALSGAVDHPIFRFATLPTQIMMAFMAVACFIGANYTFKSANQAKANIANEERTRRQMISWLTTTYDAEDIDARIEAVDGKPVTEESIEIASMKRMDMIKEFLMRQYIIDDDSYLDDISEEIYTMIYEKE